MGRTAVPTIRNLTVPDTAWFEKGACRSTHPDIFWPSSEDTIDPRALATCEACPVRTRCLLWAIRNGETAGTWGGYTPSQRAAIAGEMARRGATDNQTCEHCGGAYIATRPDRRFCCRSCQRAASERRSRGQARELVAA